jgi:hypothetical protein
VFSGGIEGGRKHETWRWFGSPLQGSCIDGPLVLGLRSPAPRDRFPQAGMGRAYGPQGSSRKTRRRFWGAFLGRVTCPELFVNALAPRHPRTRYLGRDAARPYRLLDLRGERPEMVVERISQTGHFKPPAHPIFGTRRSSSLPVAGFAR